MRDLSKNLLILLVVLTVVIIPIKLVNAQDFGTGLEVEDPELIVNVSVNIPGENKINITEELIRSKVELKLRQNDIKVLDMKDLNGNRDYFLNVYIQTLNDKSTSFYNTDLSFVRLISYNVNDNSYPKPADVWSQESIGKGDKEFIIKDIKDKTDIFINKFYEVNDF